MSLLFLMFAIHVENKPRYQVLLVRLILRLVVATTQDGPLLEHRYYSRCGTAGWGGASLWRVERTGPSRSYEKAASNTRSVRSCCFRSGPGVRDTPEPARVVARWKTGLNGALGLMATTERASFVST